MRGCLTVVVVIISQLFRGYGVFIFILFRFMCVRKRKERWQSCWTAVFQRRVTIGLEQTP